MLTALSMQQRKNRHNMVIGHGLGRTVNKGFTRISDGLYMTLWIIITPCQSVLDHSRFPLKPRHFAVTWGLTIASWAATSIGNLVKWVKIGFPRGCNAYSLLIHSEAKLLPLQHVWARGKIRGRLTWTSANRWRRLWYRTESGTR
jgi:hypothetical protein